VYCSALPKRNSTDPGGVGEVGGVFQSELYDNNRSSRREKERIRSRTSETGKIETFRWSDLTVRENTCNGARDNPRPYHGEIPTFKCDMLQKVSRISATAAVMGPKRPIERTRV
jgi:hypothetical protein